MKEHLFIFTFCIASVLLCSFAEHGKEQTCCFQKEHFKEQDWYKPFLSLLTQENRIDSADARMIKASSSSMDRSKEPIQQTTKRYGKLEEADIKLMCNMKENNGSIVYVFTRASVYIDLFMINNLIA
jgi:hypothetical protein